MLANKLFAFLIIAWSCFRLLRFAESKLPQEEIDALEEITRTMGATYWKFNDEPCKIEMVGLTAEPPREAEYNVECDCSMENSTFCHVVSIMFKRLNLPGMLPPQLVKLRYLRQIDFAYNYLNGTIPGEWASLPLKNISVLVNRLSGELPKELGNFTTVAYLNLEANQFSGALPPELGSLSNLDTLILSSNQLTGSLPTTFSELRNLTDFRINDNNFNGTIPDFIQNWKQLRRLEMQASGLGGPIPSNISLLTSLLDLRISDIPGPEQKFPALENMRSLINLVLRNCNISGEIPSYLWTRKTLEVLDVSFNKIVGEIPATIDLGRIQFLFLTGNMLSGSVPDTILKDGISLDLSYNNFAWQGPEQPTCQDNLKLNLNLFRSSSLEHNLKGGVPCLNDFKCPRYSSCWHVNSGGKEITIKENNKNVEYEGDGQVEGGAALNFLSDKKEWGFSSTGDFLDDNVFINKRFTLQSSNMSGLYSTARISPISLTYFHHCLENGNYTVELHFVEIQYTNDQTYTSLGKRIFDIYVQEKLVRKDFDIVHEAKMAQKPVVIPLYNVIVTNHSLEIRLYYAGKGTTRIPERGDYGPLISAVSVVSESKQCPYGGTKKNVSIIVGVVVGGLCLIFVILGILCWKGCFQGERSKKQGEKSSRRQDMKGVEAQAGNYTLKQLKAATNDFDYSNKIGEGGFGPVYKGQLPDGTVVAVKQLSSKSRQGNREFLNEIGMISCVQHPNLVKLHGCCIESDQLLLVYEYMENNNLARALFGPGNQLKLDWPTRYKICIGIARGLAFLHEESRLKIVHRDIKATNVLLDGDLNPKISDFGLAKLDEEEKTHVSTRVAGTIGYMAPEYALWGHLSYKADVYSFGVVALEIVSGKNNNGYVPSEDYVCLLDWACHLQQTGKLMELLDENLDSEVNKREAKTMIKVALLCTNASASVRPTMSEVVSMLEGQIAVPDIIPEKSSYSEDLRFKAMRDLRKEQQSQNSSKSQTQTSTTGYHFPSFTSTQEFLEIKSESSL
ncbi:hypothetical protein UlMin_018706 [Ulmus minor]